MKTLTVMVGLLLLTTFAGCLADDGPDAENPGGNNGDPVVSADWATHAIFAGSNPEDSDFQTVHDLGDRSLHRGLSTPNFIEQGWDPLTTDFHQASAGGYYCGEVSTEGDRKYAVVNSFTSGVALVVIDVTDPTTPEKVGELVLPRTQIYDSAITKDGQFAILATSPLAAIVHTDGTGTVLRQETYTERMSFVDNCGNTFAGPEAELPFVSGTLLIDLREPTSPEISDFVPGPAIGPHSVSSTTIDGTHYVASSITNLVYAVSYFQFFTVEELPLLGTGKLVPYTAYTANYLTDDVVSGVSLLNGHVDATIHKHPITDQIIAYLANWDGGLLTIDISTPVPTLLSSFGDSQASLGASSGSIHSAYPIEDLVNDRFLLVTGQEVGGSFNEPGNRRATGQMVVLDMTDPANPEPVARWTLPVFVEWSGNLHFSTHYPAVIDDVLFVALYHGGVWAADLRESAWPELPSLGVFLPANDPPGGAVTDTAYAPYVLDALPLEDGSLLVFDSTSGAYSVRFDRSVNVPVQAPWTEDAWIDA